MESRIAKITLVRVSDGLKSSLLSELQRAGYLATAPASASIEVFHREQPDLILLQTDVATLDCCGLLAQLKTHQQTAPIKVILLAYGGPLERSRALDLGADDVLSIPFEPTELFARIRAQLREKAPDDRLRDEVREAKQKESIAQSALQALVTEQRAQKFRWFAVAALLIVGLAVAAYSFRSVQVTNRSNARLAVQFEKLHSEMLSERQLLERAQKSREAIGEASKSSITQQIAELRADSADLRQKMSTSSGTGLTELDARLKETDSRIGKLESESRISQQIVRDYTPSTCLIYVVLGFYDKKSGAQLKFAGEDQNGDPIVDERGNPLLTTEGNGRAVHVHVFGTGFLVDNTGHILTNHHVLEPWWHNKELPVPSEEFEPTVLSLRAYFPGNDSPLRVRVEGLSEEFDLGLASVDLPKKHPKPVAISTQTAIPGSAVVLIGYPTGIDGILARVDDATLKQIAQSAGHRTEDLVQELAQRNLIRPLVTQGHLGVVASDRLTYDAPTTSGGSGGPVFDNSGKVVGVNFAILSGFTGSNFAVPITHAAKMLNSSVSATRR